MEFWKRETATKAYEWDVSDFNENVRSTYSLSLRRPCRITFPSAVTGLLTPQEPLRPDFQPTSKKPDPVTQKLVPYFPSSLRIRRYIVSVLVVGVMVPRAARADRQLSIVIWSVIAVIVFRLAVSASLYANYPSLKTSACKLISAAC